MIVKCTVPKARVVYNVTDHTTYRSFGHLPRGTIHFYLHPSVDGCVKHSVSCFDQNVDVFVYLPPLTPILYPPPRKEDLR